VATLARADASREVQQRVAQFNDEMLAEEKAAITACLVILTSAAGPAKSRVNARLTGLGGEVSRLAGDTGVQKQLKADMTAVLAQIPTQMAAMAEQVTRTSLAAMSDELEICERTLTAKYQGVAAAGIQHARDASSTYAQIAVDSWSTGVATILSRFADDVKAQLQVSAKRDDTRQQMLARLFWPTQVALPFRSGKSVWFAVTTPLDTNTTGLAIWLANSVREAAMAGFNAAYSARA
jgi:hypothetical protein